MRVLLDTRMVTQVAHGFARYGTGLVEGLRELTKESGGLGYELVLITPEGGGPLAQLAPELTRVEARSAFLSPTELWELPVLLRRHRAALYHSPTFSSLPWMVMPSPWAVTVHDLCHLRYGDGRQRLYYDWLLKPFVRRVAAVMTVSEFSRAEIAQWSGVDPSTITAAWNAIDQHLAHRTEPSLVDAALARLGLKRGQYFFCPSNPKPHKNVALLVEAYRELGDTSWPLVLTLRAFGHVPGVKALGGLADRDFLPLLEGAAAVVFPSLRSTRASVCRQ